MVFGIIWTLLLLHIFCTEVGSVLRSGHLYDLLGMVEHVDVFTSLGDTNASRIQYRIYVEGLASEG